jgi:ABC-2 type transport system ATP-binding protein
MTPGLHVRQLHKRYGDFAALTDVSFTVREGEVLGLIGPNGAGKTTLFECIAGVLPADSGTVMVKGQQVPGTDRGAHLFFMPDGIAPWAAQTVAWALDFTLGFFGGDSARLPGVIERLQIEPLMRRSVGTLSKGERKRVLLAIAMLTPQPLMMADEPFDGLDLRQSREVGAALREHAAAGRTVFLSIHQIADAARVCDRFVLLSAGHVCGEGTLDELTAFARARRAEAEPDDPRRGRASPDGLEEVVLALT